MQTARALILSHAGKKPLARYRVTLSDSLRYGAGAPDHGVGSVSTAIRCPTNERPRTPMSLRC